MGRRKRTKAKSEALDSESLQTPSKSRRLVKTVTFLCKDKYGKTQNVSGNKDLLELVSPVLKIMLSEEWYRGGPVKVKKFSAETMKVLVESVQNCHSRGLPPLSYDEVFQLALAADFFMMKRLIDICAAQMQAKASMKKIWVHLDILLQRADLKAAAQPFGKIIQENTSMCLAQAEFLQVSKDSVMFLLEQHKLHLEGEQELLKHCIDWAKLQPDPPLALKDLAIHLRLSEPYKNAFESLFKSNPIIQDYENLLEDLNIAIDAVMSLRPIKYTLKGSQRIIEQVNMQFFQADDLKNCTMLPGTSYECRLLMTPNQNLCLSALLLHPTACAPVPHQKSTNATVKYHISVFYKNNNCPIQTHKGHFFHEVNTTEEPVKIQLKSTLVLIKGQDLMFRVSLSVDSMCTWKVPKDTVSSLRKGCSLNVLVSGRDYFISGLIAAT